MKFNIQFGPYSSWCRTTWNGPVVPVDVAIHFMSLSI